MLRNVFHVADIVSAGADENGEQSRHRGDHDAVPRRGPDQIISHQTGNRPRPLPFCGRPYEGKTAIR